jgi:hypothetical protein
MHHETDIEFARACLGALAGDWEGPERLEASPWTTAGPAHGCHRLRLATRGPVLIQDYEQRRDDAITLAGHGVFAIEPATSDLLWWWFDDFGHVPLVPSRGRFDSQGSVVLEKETPRGRQQARFETAGDLLVHRIAVAPAAAGAFTPMVEATYRRR